MNWRTEVLTMAALVTYHQTTGLPWGSRDSRGVFCYSPEVVQFVRAIFDSLSISTDVLSALQKNREMFVQVAAGDPKARRKARKIFDALPPRLQSFDVANPVYH